MAKDKKHDKGGMLQDLQVEDLEVSNLIDRKIGLEGKESPKEPPTDSIKIQVNTRDADPDQALQDDFALARDSLRTTITGSSAAMEQLLRIAQDSEHPRAFEVLSEFVRSMGGAAKDLLSLHKEKKEILKTTNPDVPLGATTNIQQAVFVGSTSQLRNFLQTQKEEAAKAEVVDVTFTPLNDDPRPT